MSVSKKTMRPPFISILNVTSSEVFSQPGFPKQSIYFSTITKPTLNYYIATNDTPSDEEEADSWQSFKSEFSDLFNKSSSFVSVNRKSTIMDHHQHQLNQWRHQRLFQGNNNVCPTCSHSHVPFCQNPRFPTPENQPFISPGIDVYRSPLNMMTPQQRPVYVFDSRLGGNGFIDGGFGNYDWSDEDRSRKRVRVGEIGGLRRYGNGHVESNESFGRIAGEEDRRLKLIHEHGGVSSGQQNGGDWGLHQSPLNMDWNGSGPVPMRPGQSYGVSGVCVSPVGLNNFPVPHRFASPPYNMQDSWNIQGRYPRSQGGNEMNMVPQNMNQLQSAPPLPLSPPPPMPMEPPRPLPYEHKNPYQLSPIPSSAFPAHLGSSPDAISPSFSSASKEYHPASTFMHNRMHFPNSAGHLLQEYHAVQPTVPNQYSREEQFLMSKQWKSDKPKVIDAVHLFNQPHRATRPDHIVIILRGLPGSGKSYLAKMLRDIEVENGGDAPRIHSMDEYFMSEVEKPEEYENSKSASFSRGMRKVMEYCYEPEMEEAYRSSMLKAFKKSLEVGEFTFVIVDDRNLRVAHFAQFWAIAKSSGYEVYLLEAPYKDPAGCAARNVHSFTQDDIEKMAGEWEEAPSMYLKLDVKSMSHGDNLKETGIEEVDMDTEDEADSDLPNTQGGTTDDTGPSKAHSTNEKKQEDDNEVVAGESLDTTKELGRSKWSNDEDDEDVQVKYSGKRKTDELSNSVKVYEKKVKSIRWGDQVPLSFTSQEKDTGFSIGAAKRVAQSLVIGPGPGYNSTTNPVQADYPVSSIHKSENKKTAFQERLRAEHESFKDVFVKRKQKLRFVRQDE